MKSVLDFKKAKKNNQKISMMTAYDYSYAKIINDTSIDCILVGDSAAMVMHGYDSTVHATIEMMETHVKAVKKGAPDKFIIGDMPFLSFRKSIDYAMECVERLIHAGANAIKLEGLEGNEKIIQHIVQSGIPVMGHLGLTPQSVNMLGGYKVQGKSIKDSLSIAKNATLLEELNVFAIVLECVPSSLASEITSSLKIPTIGIGAGIDTDGQVLVLQDMLGHYKDLTPRFVRHYLNGYEYIFNALETFNTDVKEQKFPRTEESYVYQ